MEIKAIDVGGNLIILENIAYVSAIKESNTGRRFFSFGYTNSSKIFNIHESTGKIIFEDFGEEVGLWQPLPLFDFRNQIINIIKTS